MKSKLKFPKTWGRGSFIDPSDLSCVVGIKTLPRLVPFNVVTLDVSFVNFTV